jgi:uncharacterized membrane protein SirB2
MLLTFTNALAQAEPAMRLYTNFIWIVAGLLGVGGLGWLIATALGFARARAYGEPARWFAVSAMCMLLYHVQWLVLAIYGLKNTNPEDLRNLFAFFNLFIALGAVCAIVGFARMKVPKTTEEERENKEDFD